MIRQRRIALGLTQEQLANRAGVTKNYVTMVERGTRKSLGLLIRLRLAEALSVPATELLTREEAEALRMLENAITVEAAEAIVWQLQRCRDERMRPTVGRNASVLALHKLMRERPERRKDLASLESDLGRLYR